MQDGKELLRQDFFLLSQKRMSELFNMTVQDISYHLMQINETGELQLSTAIKKILNPSDNCEDVGIVLYNFDIAERRARRHVLTFFY